MSGVGIEDAAGAEARSLGASFRPDLEGLRGVAIAAVVVFHAGVVNLPGGFVGVDVFFVLSGFLISGLILRELQESGRLSFSRFYARRARRLLPAALVCIVITVALSALILTPLRVRDVAGDGVASALYVSNYRFAIQLTDYFQAQLDPSPLLHTWSLGVEEQFYLLWPALVFVAFTWRGIRGVGIALVVVGIASFALSLSVPSMAQAWAFYSLPTRAWQLCLGGGMALLAAGGWRPRPVVGTLAGAAGLAGIAASCVLIGSGQRYPGVVAFVPSGAAALVIAAGLGSARTVPSRLLALPPIRFLGRISYSLYLWHWPLVVLPTAWLGTLFGPNKRLLAVAAAVVIGWLSYRYIEDPIRRGRILAAGAKRSLAMAGGASVAVAALSIVSFPISQALPIHLGELSPGIPVNGRPEDHRPLPADLRPTLEAAEDDVPQTQRNGCFSYRVPDIGSPTCVYGDPASMIRVVLVGDSHGNQWFPALDVIAQQRHWRLEPLAMPACAFLDIRQWFHDEFYASCLDWVRAATARIVAERPDLVIVANSRYELMTFNGQNANRLMNPEGWREVLTRTLQPIVAASRVVVFADTPQSNVKVPDCLSASPKDIFQCSTPMSLSRDSQIALGREIATAAGASFVDPTPWICPSDPCMPIDGSVLKYLDSNHMTATFAASLAPKLDAALIALAPELAGSPAPSDLPSFSPSSSSSP